MKATVLVDNIEGSVGSEKLNSEWGLSLYIEYDAQKILLDSGSDGLFAVNAEKLGIDLGKVDCAVLSHAHYDHADGMPSFFEKNTTAPLYLREEAEENCYGKILFGSRYIGIAKGTLEKHSERLEKVSGDREIFDGVWLVPHKTAGLEKMGRRNHMFIKNEGKGRKWRPDDYAHEQSLVFDTPDGLVVFNSCSHSGADVIIDEVAATFPKKKIRAMVGGFHLCNKTEREVRAFAARLREKGINEIYTGHCTGDKAYAILEEELGENVHRFCCGMCIEF